MRHLQSVFRNSSGDGRRAPSLPRVSRAVQLGVAGAFGLLLAVLLGVWLLSGKARAKVERTREAQHVIARALEAYAIDRDGYPPELEPWLTSPVPYLDAVPRDPFASEAGATFQYYAPRQGGWALSSPGPDGARDLEALRDYEPLKKADSEDLVALAYDATNGTRSAGDIFRVYSGNW